MKVSVYELVMKDGSSGKVMVPFIDAGDRARLVELFLAEGAKRAAWDSNMWVCEPITKATPVSMTVTVSTWVGDK